MKKFADIIKNSKSFSPEKSLCIICAVLFAFSSILLNTLYTYTATDYLFSVTAIPEIIDLLAEISDIFAFALCYSLIIYCSVFFSFGRTLRLSCFYIALCALRRTADVVVSLIINGYMDKFVFSSACVSMILETVQVAIVLAFAASAAKEYHMENAQLKKAALRLDSQIHESATDFSCIYSKRNPLQRVALKAGIMLSVIKIITRIRYDIMYGAPSGISEILIMVVYYLSDVLVFAVFYAICWIFLSKLCSQKPETTEK